MSKDVLFKEVEIFSNNLRYLLWKSGTPKEHWIKRVTEWAGGEYDKAAGLLRGTAQPGPAFLEKVAQACRVESEDLLYRDMLREADVNVLRENLRLLIKGLGSGQKKLLASHLSIHPSTVSRWISGTQQPEKKMLVAISNYFGLRAGTDLIKEPLFLRELPVTDAERRAWLARRLEQLDAEALAELFPAVAKLLGPR